MAPNQFSSVVLSRHRHCRVASRGKRINLIGYQLMNVSSLLSFLPLKENERHRCISEELIRSKTSFVSFFSPLLHYLAPSKVACTAIVNHCGGFGAGGRAKTCCAALTQLLCPGSAGMRSSYASQHSQLGQDLRSAISPDRHIAPIYEDRTFQGPLYRSPSHNQQGTLYRSSSGWHHRLDFMNVDHKVSLMDCHYL